MTTPLNIHNPRKSFPGGANPLMRSEYVVQGDRWRIALLSDSLVRVEWSESGVFEDHCTQMVLNRDFEDPGNIHMRRFDQDGLLVIDTPSIHLTYDRRPFTKEGLQITAKGMFGFCDTWHFGDDQHANLKGTARTLDGVDGTTELGVGVNSTDGWAVLDDSASNVLVEHVDEEHNDMKAGIGGVSVESRSHPETDLYFFGYGHRYQEAVQDFYRLTGPTPLLPRFALGNWWSRYYKYSADEYLSLMDRFAEEGLPFTTSVIDMDWHITDVDRSYGSGWTGYTWNKELFPDHEAFLKALHDRGLHTTLNVHPRDGVRAFEDAYPKIADAMGINQEQGDPVEFDLTNPKFVDAYFDMHHDMEKEGVDFWWIDWQQGGVTKQVGLDPLWMLNHLHYLDSSRDGLWPLTFSRYAGPGSHRYPVGFSGDTIVSWQSLAFQPYFTATASNIGYGWWSHDIGGHVSGIRDEELEARWYQLGVFSPINRLHSSASPFNGKEPWNFHEPVRSAMVEVLRLRQELLPYLYTMNWRNASEGKELVEPMYWQYPERGEAYDVPNEYFFGSELLVAPITEAMDKETMRAKAKVWLPQGEWFDFFTGRRYWADAETGMGFHAFRRVDEIPVFAKAGGIVPLQSDGSSNDAGNPEAMDVLVFPGADGAFTIREDDGRYAPGGDLSRMNVADTEIRFDSKAGILTIAKASGAEGVVPAKRSWTMVLRGVAPTEVLLDGRSPEHVSYDQKTLSLTVRVPATATDADVVLTFPKGLDIAEDPKDDDLFSICMDAQIAYPLKEGAYYALKESGIRALPKLSTMSYESTDEQGLSHRANLGEGVIGALEEVLLRS
ncbi:TIM-barrel domain-containing protein [Bifidobacterium psychraerophilum]|uniref:glycoside hydrolase family 31 protein n=1 Tax=Bifidobacterium psychraerophilum TaxID=218140 RepID=UPI0039EA6C0F